MRRTIFLIICVFLIGLVSVVAVGAWKLGEIREAIADERDGNTALYRLGGLAHHTVQEVNAAVEDLFKTKTAADLEAVRTRLNTGLNELAKHVTAMGETRFSAHLAKPSLSSDGTDGAPLSQAVDKIMHGLERMRTAAKQVEDLAVTRADLRKKIPETKAELSKVMRRTLDLNNVDAKAYNNLMRGVMTVMLTESPSDLNFLGKAKVDESLPQLQAAMLSDTQKADLAALVKQFDASYEIVRSYISSSSDIEHFNRVTVEQLAAIHAVEITTKARFDLGQNSLVHLTDATITTTAVLAGVIALVCLVLGKLVAGSLARSLTLTMQRMTAVTAALAKGDLTARVEADGAAEISSMAGAINTTLEQLCEAIGRIHASVTTLSGRSTQLNDISAKLDDAAVNASAMTTELSTTAAQVSQNIQSVSAGIEEFSAAATEIAKSTNQAAQIGRQAMDQAQGAERTMEVLLKASQQIGSIVTAIEAITEQTKLLALNATIEAARAGDAGKGFAVVANEVKVLATKTATAAGDIRAQAEAIRNGSFSVSEAVGAVAKTIAKVNEFQLSIAGSVEEQAATTRELARHLGQAATGGAEIACGVDEVAVGAKTNSEHAKTVLTSAKDLSLTTTELDGFVGRFRY